MAHHRSVHLKYTSRHRRIVSPPQFSPELHFISDHHFSNTLELGSWSFNISDTPTLAPQGFNTTCNYQSAAAYFAVSEPPINAPCTNPNVTFGLFPDTNAHDFVFNVTHVWWGSCGG